MNSYEPHGTKITVRVRSSNDKQSWSAWEDAINGASLRLTPRGRYLEVEVTLEKFNSAQSPVVYDVTVNTLDSTALTTDLGVTITGNKNTLNLGDTVKLAVTAFNNGPTPSASVKVNYKIPLGLKLLSYNGAGTYDSSTGIWSVGTLPVGGDATMELILQSNNAGSIVNTATVYSDLPDLNPLNNQAGFNLVANAPDLEDIPDGELNGLPYTFPPDIKPPNPPTPPDTPPIPPTPPLPPSPPTPGPTPPGLGPLIPPKTQLDRDIDYVRKRVAYNPPKDTDENQTTSPPQMPEWKLDTSIISEILIAAAMLATSAVAARFLNGNVEELKSNFGKWAMKNLGVKNPTVMDFILFGISIGLFAIDPTLLDAVMIFMTICGLFFDFIFKMMFSGTMQIFGYFLLAVAIIKLVEKYFGLDVIQMATDKLSKFKEIIINEFKPIIDHLKQMFGIK